MSRRRTEPDNLVKCLKRLEKALNPSKRTLEEVRQEWQEGIKNNIRTLTTIRRIERMTDEIISVTKLEDTSHHFAVYEILTSQLNHIGDHVIVYKVINEYGRSYLTDDGYTWNELEMHGFKFDDMVWPLRCLLHDYPFVYMEGDEFCASLEDVDFNCRLRGLLAFIDSVYKEFLE